VSFDLKAHLKTLCDLHGPAGYEGAVREAIADAWRPFVDDLDVGRLGSLVGYKLGTGEPPRRRIMLCAHMDEIGLIVHAIEDGFLRVSHLGGTDERTLAGMPVLVHGRETLRGVVGTYPRHTLPSEQQGRYPIWDELFVDVGLPADQVTALVSVGDVITPDTPLIDLQGGRIAAKAADNRASVAAVTACLNALRSRRHEWDVLAVASVQEETGAWAASREAHRLQPDIAIALDVTFATQPGVDGPSFKLGSGPSLALGPNFHPALYAAISAAGERMEIDLPPEPTPAGSGTDAWMIQVARDGIPTALISIPVRNMHTTVETLDLKDIERTGRVLAEFIAGLAPDFLATIVWDKEDS
jgi:endoglucanase